MSIAANKPLVYSRNIYVQKNKKCQENYDQSYNFTLYLTPSTMMGIYWPESDPAVASSANEHVMGLFVFPVSNKLEVLADCAVLDISADVAIAAYVELYALDEDKEYDAETVVTAVSAQLEVPVKSPTIFPLKLPVNPPSSASLTYVNKSPKVDLREYNAPPDDDCTTRI